MVPLGKIVLVDMREKDADRTESGIYKGSAEKTKFSTATIIQFGQGVEEKYLEENSLKEGQRVLLTSSTGVPTEKEGEILIPLMNIVAIIQEA